MALNTAPSAGPIQRPFGIEQGPFFQVPREIRDLIYEQVFVGGKSDDGALNPLATCRQFYTEALSIAWSLVTFRFDWSNIAHKYFSHQWTPPFPINKEQPDRFLFSWQQTTPPEPVATGTVYSGLTPADFTIRAMATRAGLSEQHIRAIRKIHVTIFVGLPRAYSSFTNFWILWHFVQGLKQIPGPSNFGQLDRLTIERECDGSNPAIPNLVNGLRSSMSVFWDSNIAKRIVTIFPYSIHQSKTFGDLWSKQERDRFYFAAGAHVSHYGDKLSLDAESQHFDTCEGDMRWEWRYHCMTERRPGFRLIRYIEVVKYGEAFASDLKDEYWVDMQATPLNGQSITPLVILSKEEAVEAMLTMVIEDEMTRDEVWYAYQSWTI